MTSCDLKNEACGGICTGYDGSKVWEKRRKLIDEIDCESCNEEAHKLETFTHDIVNARLGKKVYDKENFHKFVDVVNCVSLTCRKNGNC